MNLENISKKSGVISMGIDMKAKRLFFVQRLCLEAWWQKICRIELLQVKVCDTTGVEKSTKVNCKTSHLCIEMISILAINL